MTLLWFKLTLILIGCLLPQRTSLMFTPEGKPHTRRQSLAAAALPPQFAMHLYRFQALGVVTFPHTHTRTYTHAHTCSSQPQRDNNNSSTNDNTNTNARHIPLSTLSDTKHRIGNTAINHALPLFASVLTACQPFLSPPAAAHAVSAVSQRYLKSVGGAIGYEAAPSVFSPGQPCLYIVPLLPQSALLNTLPLLPRNTNTAYLIGEVQAYIESFVQLINPSLQQEQQLSNNESVLWRNLGVNAQRAAGIVISNKARLLPNVTGMADDDLASKAVQLADANYRRLTSELLKLINASRKADLSDSLKYMKTSLNCLSQCAYLLTAPTLFPAAATASDSENMAAATNTETGLRNTIQRFTFGRNSNNNRDDNNDLDTDSTGRPPEPRDSAYDTQSIKKFTMLSERSKRLPSLIGRATVKLVFERPGPAAIINRARRAIGDLMLPAESDTVVTEDPKTVLASQQQSKVVIVVDGINNPLTAGNFIDLCQRQFYDGLEVKQDNFSGFENVIAAATAADDVVVSASSPANDLIDQAPPVKITPKPARLTRTILGDYGGSQGGFVDPLTELQRRVPLEVMREEVSSTASTSTAGKDSDDTLKKKSTVKRFTVTGGGRNSAVFAPLNSQVRTTPVKSLATYGAIAMNHARGDHNGGSSSFFWIPADVSQTATERDKTPLFTLLKNQYSVFAYAIEGNDVLEGLLPGDVLISAEVEDGLWTLVEPEEEDEYVE